MPRAGMPDVSRRIPLETAIANPPHYFGGYFLNRLLNASMPDMIS